MPLETAMDDSELLRYSRHLMLPEIEVEGQERLRRASVLIVGAGGLGAPVAMYLAAAGVGRLVLVDHDRVEASNLQRQICHGEADIGRSKVESARDTLRALNPLVEVEAIGEALGGDALRAAVEGADVVVDCTDNLPTRFAINAACVQAARPLVIGAAVRLEGQLLVYRPDRPDAPCYRCLYRGDEIAAESCSENGVLGPLVGVIGSLQAVEVIKLLVGIGESAAGRLLLYDARLAEWVEVLVPRNPACPACGGRSAPPRR